MPVTAIAANIARCCFISALLLTVGCSQVKEKYQDLVGEPKSERPLPDYRPERERPVPVPRRLPWETWSFGRDLMGNDIKLRAVIEGDEFVKNGERRRALEAYRIAEKANLLPIEREAVVLRIAGTELALGQPARALATLSAYFRKAGVSEKEVDTRFSLIFAYAYGGLKDNNQSLAWFSKVNRVSGGQGAMADRSTDGVRMLLKSLPDRDFFALASSWQTDSFVRTLIGNESRNRSSRDSSLALASKTEKRHFWEVDRSYSVAAPVVDPGNKMVVGVLLPLSGKYAQLGKSMKNGIELGIKGQGIEEALQIIYEDTAGDALQASARARELAAVRGAAVVLGPLLSEPASAASEVARQYRMSQLAFPKAGYFVTGDGIYRLGPTIESQVKSLLEGVYRSMGVLRFALVYPEDGIGSQYADAFRRSAQQFGLDLVYESSYPKGDNAAIVAIAGELADIGPQAVFLPSGLLTASQFMRNLPVGMKGRLRVLGPANWDDPARLANSRTVLEGVVFVSPFFSQSERPIVGQFVSTYKATYGRSPDFLAAQGFDAATLLGAAVKRHSQEGISFRQAFNEIDSYSGLTGTIQVGDSGEIQRQFAVVELKQGKRVELIDSSPSFVYRGNDSFSETTPPTDASRGSEIEERSNYRRSSDSIYIR